MRIKALLFTTLFVTIFTTKIMAQTNYYVSHGANVTISHATHYPKAINIYGTESPVQLLDNIASAPYCAAYFDKTSTVFEVRAGETVTPNISINGDWMHGYVYVDWNNNGQFDVDVTGTVNGSPHNTLLQILYSTGVIGFGLLIGVIVIYLIILLNKNLDISGIVLFLAVIGCFISLDAFSYIGFIMVSMIVVSLIQNKNVIALKLEQEDIKNGNT